MLPILNIRINEIKRRNMFIEFLKFFVYSILIVLISKYALVKFLRNLAQNLGLKSKTIGNISGIATSIPELLTVSFSALTGFIDTSIFNILSSNIINVIQYIISIFLNQNYSNLKKRPIKIDLILVLITIIVPIIIIVLSLETKIIFVPVFLILFIVFYKISKNAHKINSLSEKNIKKENVSKKIVIINVLEIILTGVSLYYIGNLLSNTLEILATKLNIPEFILGILLGIVTSIPEFITFFEAQKHHKNKDINEGIVEATSNLLFSNIMNLFIIQSIGITFFVIFS